MSQARQRTIRKFNPGIFQTDQEIMEQFVVRRRELNTVLEVIRGNVESPSCQHTLIVGPRGRGKTMLLARVAAELRTDPHLKETLLPVRFMEESLEVFDIGDFWLEALFHLARECARSDLEVSEEIEATRHELASRARGEDIARHARASVLDASDRLGKKLVLMVENLQDLSDDVGEDFGWQLREALQSEPRIILLGSATSRFAALDDTREPFFELFRILPLNPLNTAECGRLWRVISGERRTDRQMRPLEIFTGGSPRLLVLLAEFGRHRSTPQLLEDMVGLIDDHTEYFRGHLEALAKTERRVYLALADLWRPSTTSEIADRARLGVRKVSSLLGRLRKRGAVTVEGQGRNRLYAVAERLYCIYYKLRHQRDDAAVVRGVIRFMATFYEPREAAALLGTLLSNVEFHDAFFGGDAEIDLAGIAPGMAAATRRELAQRSETSGNGDGHERVASELLDVGSKFGQSGQLARSIEYSDEVILYFASSPEPRIQSTVAKAILNKGLAKQGAGLVNEALSLFSEVPRLFADLPFPDVEECLSTALLQSGYLHAELRQPEEAIAAYDEAIDRFGTSQLANVRLRVAMCLLNKGATLVTDDPSAAQAAWGELVERFIDDHNPEIEKHVAAGLVMTAGAAVLADDGERAIKACNVVVERYGESGDERVQRKVAGALEMKAQAQNRMRRPQEALATCRLLVEKFGGMEGDEGVAVSWRAKGIEAMAHVQQRNEAAALRAFKIIYNRLDDANPAMLRRFVWDLIDLVACGARPGPFADVLDSVTEESEGLIPLLAALRKLSGSPMRIPEEVSLVADDVIDQINARTHCPACGGSASRLPPAQNIDGARWDCLDYCGPFVLTGPAEVELQNLEESVANIRLRLAAWLHRRLETNPTVTTDVVESLQELGSF